MAENCPHYRSGKCDNPTSPGYDCSWARSDYERCSVYVLITDPVRGKRQLLAAFCGSAAGATDEDGTLAHDQTQAPPTALSHSNENRPTNPCKRPSAYRRALDYLGRCGSSLNWFKSSPGTPAQVFASAISLYREAQPGYVPNSIDFPSFDKVKIRRAYDMFCDCVWRAPNNADVRLMKAQCAYDLYDRALIREALDDVKRVMESSPKNAQAQDIFGSLMYVLEWGALDEMAKLELQIANKRKVLELDSNYASDLGTLKAFGRESTTNAFHREELANMERALKKLQLEKQLANEKPAAPSPPVELPPFSALQVKTVDEAIRALFDGALKAVPTATEIKIERAHLELADAWDSKKLFEGSESEIREIVRGNLVALAHRADFMMFKVEALQDRDPPAAQVNTFLRDPMRFVGVRVWRATDKVFACGNAAFR